MMTVNHAHRRNFGCLFIALCLIVMPQLCQAGSDPGSPVTGGEGDELRIQWRTLLGHTMTFLAVSHAFRLAKERYTREATFNGPYLSGVGTAFEKIHGWSDGDEFLTNYIGHPMQGAVSGYIFSHNDPKYRDEEFGKEREYWRGKTRAFAFSALYSLQFEIGPVSEATIGKIQAYWPQRGVVDWVITPTLGLGWSLAEDSLDQYAVKNLERKIQNPYFRALLRSGLNPARSFANLMALNAPWHRDSRPGVRECSPKIEKECFTSHRKLPVPLDPSDPYGRKHASFSFTVPLEVTGFGKMRCIGGGTNLQLGLNQSWDLIIDISGCKLMDLPDNYSGDSLSYMLGAQWAPKTSNRISPSLRVMVGGHKVSEELQYPKDKNPVPSQESDVDYYSDICPNCIQAWERTGLALSIGAGVDLGINRALGIRLAGIDYMHSWMGDLNGISFSEGIRFSSGLAVNVGGW